MKLTDVLANGLIIVGCLGATRSAYLVFEEAPSINERSKINREIKYIKEQLDDNVSYRTLAKSEYSLPQEEITRTENLLTRERELEKRRIAIERDPEYQKKLGRKSEGVITGVGSAIFSALFVAYQTRKYQIKIHKL